jgi:hypothetical protein
MKFIGEKNLAAGPNPKRTSESIRLVQSGQQVLLQMPAG